jgi:pSer/pThr/pTyr-binding forkhead associated (FHA) protein
LWSIYLALILSGMNTFMPLVGWVVQGWQDCRFWVEWTLQKQATHFRRKRIAKMTVEYWCDQGLEIAVEGPEGRFCVKVEKPFARIGRHRSSEVVLPSKEIPRRAFYLHATPAGVYFFRLAPSASDNDQPAEGWLATGQTLKIGLYRIAVQVAGEQAQPVAPLPDFTGADLAEPYPVLMITRQGERIAPFPLRRRLTAVGRDPHNALQLADSQVSTSHCVLYRQQDELWIIDLLSSNGTFLGRHRLEAAVLAPGQPATLGNQVKLVCLPASQTDENLDELTLHVTGRMIQLDRQTRRRRRLMIAAVALVVLVGAATGVYFLPREYLASLRQYVLSLWKQSG